MDIGIEHLIGMGIAIIGLWWRYDAQYQSPLRKWRLEMDKWAVGVDKDLERGRTKMSELSTDMKCLDGKVDKVLQRLTSIETILRERSNIPPD